MQHQKSYEVDFTSPDGAEHTATVSMATDWEPWRTSGGVDHRGAMVASIRAFHDRLGNTINAVRYIESMSVEIRHQETQPMPLSF